MCHSLGLMALRARVTQNACDSSVVYVSLSRLVTVLHRCDKVTLVAFISFQCFCLLLNDDHDPVWPHLGCGRLISRGRDILTSNACVFTCPHPLRQEAPVAHRQQIPVLLVPAGQ
jgi:hypothetical protein